MSDMEIFIGKFWECPPDYCNPEDTDDFYDLEERDGCHYVKVNGRLFAFVSIKELDSYGFSTVVPEQTGPLLLCYWYNGGAELHEVVEGAIKRWIDE